MQVVPYIVKLSGLPEKSIQNTLSLFADGATVPFISRYRKEATGNLDEVAIEAIKKNYDNFQVLQKCQNFDMENLLNKLIYKFCH